ncbi:MAG: hypothetical protein KatS3mg076_2708 [Candidatus Binatia bacterium]|nr:MAG: hypothetical protein KatS3mg076_2708 [Candidatus Binatia bacterium]
MQGEEHTGESEIGRLVALQQVDQRLRERELLAGTLRREIEEREKALREKKNREAALLARREELEAKRRALEARMDEEASRMKDRRMRLNRVRTEKELLAIRREIELGKEATQQMEAELLLLLEETEVLDRELREVREELASSAAPAEAEISERKERLRALEEEAREDRELREHLAGRIDPGLRRRYEQIFARREGLAVVSIRDGTCTGCHRMVPPQLVNEIQRARDVRVCPNCHRMLYWPEDS